MCPKSQSCWYKIRNFLSNRLVDLVDLVKDLISKIAEIRKFSLGIWTRFKCYIWDRNLLRHIIMFLAAVWIVRIVFTDDEWIKNLGCFMSYIQELLKSGGFWKILSLCIASLALFGLALALTKIKGIKFFIFSFLAFFAVRYWSYINNNLINPLIGTLSDLSSQPPNWNVILNFSNILHLMAAILLGVLLYLFIRFLSHSGGIDILPFENIDSNSKNELIKGLASSDALASELHRISDIYTYTDNCNEDVKLHFPALRGCRESIEPLKLRLSKRENLDVAFSQAGSIPITDKATLQIGALLFAIRQLWPSGSSQVITGSICNCHSKKRLFARYEEANHASKSHAYTVTQEEVEEVEQEQKKKFWHEKFWHEKSDDPVSKMVQSLASRIAVDSSSTNFSTSDWVAFQSFTEALFHFYRYEKIASKNSPEVLAELDTAFVLCQIAIEKDKDYKIVSDLLSEISESYLNHAEFKKAKDALDLAMKINPNNSHVHSTYGGYYYLLGDNEKAKDYYEYAKELDPNDPKIYLRLGAVHLVDTSTDPKGNFILRNFDKSRKNFWSALDLDPRNNTAKSLLAWLDFLCYLEELKKEPETTKKLYNYLYLVCVLENLPEKSILWSLFLVYRIPICNIKNWLTWPIMTLSSFHLNPNCYKQASRNLHNAISRLKQIPQDKKTYIDYSNLAIFLLHKKLNVYEEEIQRNWWKAKQLCSGNKLDNNQTVYNRLHYIFYNFLTLTSSDKNLENIFDLEQLLYQICRKRDYHQRVIENLLIDARIILVKCMEESHILSGDDEREWNKFDKKFQFMLGINRVKPPIDLSNRFSEEDDTFPRNIGRAMQEFIKTLDPDCLKKADGENANGTN